MTELESTDTCTAPWALENLPPFPAVTTRILRLVCKEDVQLSEVGALIAADPVFASDVLQVANSALFALRYEVNTIAHAIAVLGLQRVRSIGLTRSLGSYLSPALKIEALRRCWENSLAGAILAERLARACGIDRDTAYTGGLLRDIGRLALLVKYPQPYANMLIVTQENSLDLMATERELFDVDHCQAGFWLTDKMQIPSDLREVVARHHERLNGEPFGLVQLVHIADRMSDALGFGVLNVEDQTTFTEVLEELPEPLRRCVPQDAEELRADAAEKMLVLGGPTGPGARRSH